MPAHGSGLVGRGKGWAIAKACLAGLGWWAQPLGIKPKMAANKRPPIRAAMGLLISMVNLPILRGGRGGGAAW